MDFLSILGVALAFGAVLGGNWLEGGHISSLANGPALIIVFGGTIGAALLQTPMSSFFRAMRMAGMVFYPPSMDLHEAIGKMVAWSARARKEGLLGLEEEVDLEEDLFIRKGMQLLVDGSDPVDIRHALEVEMDTHEQRDIQATKFFEAMGGYAPTIGIIGAVMGLIHVMQNLSDPSKLGGGIATAFVATIYGVALANLLVLPFAEKLKSLVMKQSHYRELIIEGYVAIAEGENPRAVEYKLQGFLH